MPNPLARRTGLAAGALVASSLLAACTPSLGSRVPHSGVMPAAGRVTVTGYDRVGPATGSSGPVTVELTAVQARRLAALVDALARVRAPIGLCHEDDTLFVITVSRGAARTPAWRATADVCPGVLTVPTTHGRSLVRTDRDCALRLFVDRLFPPGRANGTRGYAASCVWRG